jgi:cyclic beta-1,2-glucan synthetase
LAELFHGRWNRLKSSVELHAWDGEWYRRAFFDNGSPLGSRCNDECRIDSLAQSWAVICGEAMPERMDSALQAVEQHLVREEDKLILLFSPPFRRSEPSPGYIKTYPAGVRENGGQYTHAALWVALALLRQGKGGRAVSLLRMINPIERTRSSAEAFRYKCEPYVLAADVYCLEGQVGRAGWSWYTGASAWMYRIWVEEVLGFKLRGKILKIDPTIPAAWPGFRLSYKCGYSVYRITVENPGRAEHGIAWVEIDGKQMPDGFIHVEDDGRDHTVRVQMISPDPLLETGETD